MAGKKLKYGMSKREVTRSRDEISDMIEKTYSDARKAIVTLNRALLRSVYREKYRRFK